MKATLYRYLFREISVPFLLGMTTFTSVLLMGRLLKLADMVVAKGVPFSDVLWMVVYLLPYFCLVTIPMAVLLAVLLAFGRLSADSEVTAMKACGISLYGLLPPVIAFALFAYIATTLVTLYGIPWGNTSFRRLVTSIAEERGAKALKEQVFIDDFPGLMLYLNRYSPQDQRITGILIQDDRNPAEPSTIFASSGVIFSDPATREIRLLLYNGGIHRPVGKTGYRLVEFQEYDLKINIPQATQEVLKNEMDMSLSELYANINSPRLDRKLRTDMELEVQRRFSLPFACFVFALIAIPLGIQNQRSGKGAGFSLSIGVLIVYYVILTAFKAMGERGMVTPLVAMWSPNLLFVAFGIYLFHQTAEERRLYLFTALAEAGRRIRHAFTTGRTP
ncbi:LPS export ABC transporter permease LptF [Geomobilimonas luticola]|uniref:LPS export ABC transporter permease LptF n=1 Tax=Geomobilimonas luticola TaxID=1114878 RepID=A0ABS5SFV6_9BACT|nr:LPS export ABC transporter permease LptF [Geomobilimonas luticola]MBT0654246.1 LPS export ABC transporter permease LptF [Geomobilimonas luticola]